MADMLSRPVNPVSVAQVDFRVMSRAQAGMANQLEDSSLQMETIPWQDVQMLCDVSKGVPRPVVPVAFRRQLFDHLHGLSHPGIRPC